MGAISNAVQVMGLKVVPIATKTFVPNVQMMSCYSVLFAINTIAERIVIKQPIDNCQSLWFSCPCQYKTAGIGCVVGNQLKC
jgi:hypothetical protein